MSLQFTQIASNMPGAEGPVVDRLGRVFCVEPHAGSVWELLPDGTRREHANTGGVPAGLFVDRHNQVWIADMKLGILRLDPAGKVTPVVTTFEGQPMRGCNDLCISPTDDLYFTAPAGSSAKKPVGEVYSRTREGVVRKLDSGYQFCNGIALSADGRLLIVAETATKKLWAFDITEPGVAVNKRLWATLPGEHNGGPDGMDFDATGLLLATNWGGGAIEVFDKDGKLVERLVTPFDRPSNVHFGGPDGKRLYVTEHSTNGVWTSTWRHAGQAMPW
jgi:gluconolactonase